MGEDALGLDGVIAAVAERVAAQDTPRRQHEPAEYAVPLDRLRGVVRARRLVLAPARQQPGRSPAGRAGWVRRRRDARSSRVRRGQPGLVEQLADRRLDACRARRGRTTQARRGERRSRRRDRQGTRSASAANASRSRRLTRLRSTAPPTFRDTDRPSRAESAGSRASRGEHVQDEIPPAVRAALAVHALELGATRETPTLGATGRGELMRQLVHRGLPQTVRRLRPLARRRFRDDASGLRLHPLAESVRASALALLGLVGALHGLAQGSPLGGAQAIRAPVHAPFFAVCGALSETCPADL